MQVWRPSSARRLRPTHEVFNQPPPLEGYNVFAADTALVEALRREGADWAEDEARELGALCGLPQTIRWGVEANQNPPKLRTHDRFGNRIDEVEFHPAWHELMRIGIGARPARARPGASRSRAPTSRAAALFMLLAQVEAGVGCPISMTYSVIPALRTQPELAAEWEPRFLSLSYDGERLVPAPDKKGALCGMGMTEKQGGSDVRANTTTARPLNGGGPGGEYEITGHKWFFSAPMCDAFLVLAQADGGLSCFLLPRFTPERRAQPHPPPATQGQARQPLQRLLRGRVPGRLGADSSARRGAACRRSSRWSTTPASTASLGAAAGHALGHRGGDPPLHPPGGVRQAAGRAAADAERAGRPGDRVGGGDGRAMRLARTFDQAHAGDEAAASSSGASRPRCSSTGPASAAPVHAVEALECLGGNGYVEESGMPRLYRESPLASIWEGSGNVQCLDVLRAMARSPDRRSRRSSPRSDEAGGAEPRLDAAVAALRDELADLEAIEARARRVVERMALALQGSLLVRYGDPAVADAFCASRLAGDAGLRLRHPAGRAPTSAGSSSATRRGPEPAAQGLRASARRAAAPRPR